MKIEAFLKDRILMMIFQLIGLLLLSVYLHAVGIQTENILIIVCFYLLMTAIYLSFEYLIRRHYFNNVRQTFEALDQKYLISDVIARPQRYEDELFTEILRKSTRSMLEEITKIRHERLEYKEYIEQWVHEVKTPLSGMKLICENNKNEDTRKILRQLEQTDRYVEQALFFARSDDIVKDYLIRECSLNEAAKNAVLTNKHLLIAKGVVVHIDCTHQAYTDGKWITFILNQILTNAAKYGAKNIWITTKEVEHQVMLDVRDDGIGIRKEDISRVFEKGFTGNNGHEQQKSTGLGLYICSKLCKKLNMGIQVTSTEGKGTTLTLLFS